MSAKRNAIAAIYAQLAAPAWAGTNLDGLADVLRDLSWLPDGPVRIALPDLAELDPDDRSALVHTLTRAVTESRGTPHPIELAGPR